MRDAKTIELYLPLFSTVIVKQKDMLYVLQGFKNGLSIKTLWDSQAYFSATDQIEMDKLKQQALLNSSKSTILRFFKNKYQMAR